MAAQFPKYAGAWLTDIDDTLFKSGEFPDDEQIAALADFVRVLKKHDILWAPVSGVAIEKMGPRILYRLPRDVLSHVIYYGGEGSTRHHFDEAQEQWLADPRFQRNFSDAQSLALIGRERFEAALLANRQLNLTAEEVRRRITEAEAILQQAGCADQECLVGELETLLDEAGFDAEQSETYFRGGAISWMMFGDISVEHYKDAHKTAVRTRLNDYLRKRLAELDYLTELGDSGVHMPYLHATRGIKLVLMGNDKARAAEDLIDLGIPAEAILFTGNELFAGGNDDSVRRVEGVTLLSVGEKADPGVIEGGVQTEANQAWMQFITTALETGQPWQAILHALPETAANRQLSQVIDHHREHSPEISAWHGEMSGRLPTEFLVYLHRRNRDKFLASRKCRTKLKKTEYALVARLSSLEGYHYDYARKIVCELFTETKLVDKSRIISRLKTYLLPEIRTLLQKLLADQGGMKPRKIQRLFREVKAVEELGPVLWRLFQNVDADDPQEEFDHAMSIVNNWAYSLESLVDHYFEKHAKWCMKRVTMQRSVMDDPRLKVEFPQLDNGEVFRYFIWLAPRLEKTPHFKDLDKPTIVLVSGTSGVGKSTISQHISRSLGIPTGFSSDVASRSVMRQATIFLLGQEKARDTFPELFGSSFEKDSLTWFYTHAMLTMVGVTGNINRLVKENISAVIDGVALIPGTLPEHYFETANIVWLIISVSDKQLHFERLGTRSETGVERGGSERYQRQFSAIRSNHDRLVTMGRRAGKLVIDNSGDIQAALDKAIKRVADPFAERGLRIEDSIRDQVEKDLQERTTWEVQHKILNTEEV